MDFRKSGDLAAHLFFLCGATYCGWYRGCLVVCVTFLVSIIGQCDEKKEAGKEPPKITMTLPLAISPGENSLLTLRGFQLDQATSVQIPSVEPAVTVTIRKKEKSAIPEKLEAKDAGDSLVEVEFTLPVNFSGESLPLIVTSANGTSTPFAVRVIAVERLTTETEPNDSLRKPQTVQPEITIIGAVWQAKDVDVYEFAGLANQSFVAEVVASQAGSPCDAHLTLFNSAGQILAIADDTASGRDALLRVVLPRDDSYRIVLLDATDRGSVLHLYLLKLHIE